MTLAPFQVFYTHDGEPVQTLLTQFAGAASAALAQSPKGVPPIAGLWHGQPIGDCAGLFLWVEEWVPVVRGQFPQPAVGVDRCKPLTHCPRVVLTLLRPCAPIPDDRGQVSATLEASSAEDMLQDIRALLCGVKTDWPALLETMVPGARIEWGPATPTAEGDFFGWDWRIFVEWHGCLGC